MEGVVQLHHRQDLDMPDRISPRQYRKLLGSTSVHERRLSRLVERAEGADGNDVHLHYCFTGWYSYGQHFIMACWPAVPRAATYRAVPRDVLRIKDAHVEEHGENPLRFSVEESGDEKRKPDEYHFYREDPHQPHRPYFLHSCDALFGRRKQDDAVLVAYHAPDLLTRLGYQLERLRNLPHASTPAAVKTLDALLSELEHGGEGLLPRFFRTLERLEAAEADQAQNR